MMEKNIIPANVDNDLKYRADLLDPNKKKLKKKDDGSEDAMVESTEGEGPLQYFTE